MIDQQTITSTVSQLQEQSVDEIIRQITRAIFWHNELFCFHRIIEINSVQLYIFHAEKTQEEMIQLFGYKYDRERLDITKKMRYTLQKNDEVISQLLVRLYTDILLTM